MADSFFADHPGSRRVIGLMSGTSVDGIDAALVLLRGSGASLQAELLAFECPPFDPLLRSRVLHAIQGEANVAEVARLNVWLGEAFAAAAGNLIALHGAVDLIGSHGQTVCHLPAEGVTLQLGEPAIIAERTQTTVVADFRPRDLAAGGQGAPLIPYVDWVLLRHPERHRIVQNIGGIANCTLLKAGGPLQDVTAWDTGPGNMLMDACARALLGQNQDEDGRAAAAGRPNHDLVARLLRHPYLQLRPPKTAGHEQFGAAFAAQFLGDCHETRMSAPDVLATATFLTAASIAQSYRDFVPGFPGHEGNFEIIVGGGGAFNPTLRSMLAASLNGSGLLTHEDIGLRSDAKEAMAFAILAHETLNGVATSVSGATGAGGARVLGKIVMHGI